MEAHVRRVHSQKSGVGYRLRCGKCEQKFNLEEELNAHIETLHAEGVYSIVKNVINLMKQWVC